MGRIVAVGTLLSAGQTEGRRQARVIGRVLGIHIDDRFIVEGRIDTVAMRPLARLGYSEYAAIGESFRMRRPD